MSCGVGHRNGSDPASLWLWYSLAAIAPIRPLAWEPPYAIGAKKQKIKTRKKEWLYELDFNDCDACHIEKGCIRQW